MILNQPFADEWRESIVKNISMFKRLPKNYQSKLEELIKYFIATTKFEGCKNFVITDEVKVTIAAQASLLILNKPMDTFKKLHTVLVYSSTFSSERNVEMQSGLVSKERVFRSGESWIGGTVILSWNHVLQGAYNQSDGKNVTIHEFAHQLDQDDGVSDGTPILEDQVQYSEWARIFGESYQNLHSKINKNKKSFIDEYGATNPAEFFAVVTEYFFEKPNQLQRKHPILYTELSNYYKLNPSEWK